MAAVISTHTISKSRPRDGMPSGVAGGAAVLRAEGAGLEREIRERLDKMRSARREASGERKKS